MSAELEADLAALAGNIAARDEALGMSGPWPFYEVLRQLADATDHLLKVHDCDHLGWEETDGALNSARAILARLGETQPDVSAIVKRWAPTLREQKPTMPSLTTRQAEVLAEIRTFTAAHGYSPSIKQIMRVLGVSGKNGVHEHLAALERKGWISRDPSTARSIRVLSTEAPTIIATHHRRPRWLPAGDDLPAGLRRIAAVIARVGVGRAAIELGITTKTLKQTIAQYPELATGGAP